MINYWRSLLMKDADDESPLNNVRLLLDCRSYFMVASTHEKCYAPDK